MNRPAKGFTPEFTIFALQLKPRTGPAQVLALKGPVESLRYSGAFGVTAWLFVDEIVVR